MTALSPDKVLRINCPGFGVSSILPLGEAKPLAMYEVIVVNPTSVLHLFDNASDVIKQIEVLQSDGMTSYRAESDAQLENIQAEMDLRSQELNQFLKKGGLLVFFLSPPFTVSGPSISMDNYSWLGEWCPDKPSGPNQRNMSATIRGKAIETSADAAQSVWVPYLKQAGLEWSTIIRNDNLSEGFVPLAAAGPNKCISGFKSSGPKAGQIVFLPAPYASEYDGKLKECLERWYALHTDDATAGAGLQTLSKGLSSLLSDEPEEAEEQPQAVSAKSAPAEEPAPPPPMKEDVPVNTVPEPVLAETNGSHKEELEPEELEVKPAKKESKPEPEKPEFFDKKADEPAPDALIKKMQQNIPQADVPEWCAKFSFAELDGLREQLEEVNDGIRRAQLRAQELTDRISTMDSLKNALLSAEGEQLTNAVTTVFNRLGWTVKPALGSQDELWLVEDEKTQSIVRLIFCPAQPNRAELAALAESVITYWGAHEVEPKGILVASTWSEKEPHERTEEDFPESMNEFAKRKNLCLLTTAQLLSIFRDLDIGTSEAKEIRENILTTSGRVSDYQFNFKGTTAAKR